MFRCSVAVCRQGWSSRRTRYEKQYGIDCSRSKMRQLDTLDAVRLVWIVAQRSAAPARGSKGPMRHEGKVFFI
jgi:hypothetical protein